ncbi:hypothetical protein BDQ17DRAFT_1424655 [Cyathus striatus]|nr:hypothetical protein BDQ17DRAFT_1424655 [Cyathus striatus]
MVPSLEILSFVVGHIETTDKITLICLGLTCRALHVLTTPMIYSRMSSRRFETHIKFLKTLISSPPLAQYVEEYSMVEVFVGQANRIVNRGLRSMINLRVFMCTGYPGSVPFLRGCKFPKLEVLVWRCRCYNGLDLGEFLVGNHPRVVSLGGSWLGEMGQGDWMRRFSSVEYLEISAVNMVDAGYTSVLSLQHLPNLHTLLITNRNQPEDSTVEIIPSPESRLKYVLGITKYATNLDTIFIYIRQDNDGFQYEKWTRQSARPDIEYNVEPVWWNKYKARSHRSYVEDI